MWVDNPTFLIVARKLYTQGALTGMGHGYQNDKGSENPTHIHARSENPLSGTSRQTELSEGI